MAALRLNTAGRLIAALLTMLAAWQAYEFAFIVNVRRVDPKAALMRSPADALALANAVRKEMEKTGTYVANIDDERHALLSLKVNPLSRASLRIIGANADLANDSERALAAMSLSDRVSRRDTIAQVWLLRRAALQNDYSPLLRHYHAAIAVTPSLGPMVHPLLVAELRDERVREALRPYAQQGAPWMAGFLDYASRDAEVVDLLELIEPISNSLSGEDFEASMARIIVRLAERGDSDKAMDLAEATWDNFDPADFAKASINQATTDQRLGALAWNLNNGAGIESRVAENGGLEASLGSLSRAFIARRTFPVSPGKVYNISQRVNFDGRGAARIFWRGDCVSIEQSNKRTVWEQTVPASDIVTTYRYSFQIPAGCTMLQLTLEGNGPERQGEASLALSELVLEAE